LITLIHFKSHSKSANRWRLSKTETALLAFIISIQTTMVVITFFEAPKSDQDNYTSLIVHNSTLCIHIGNS
jgi:hypothetical protein